MIEIDTHLKINPNRRTYAVILTGPNGCGKGTIGDNLLHRESLNLGKVIRHTTRRRGVNETDMRDYYFITDSEFHRMKDESEFVEYSSHGKEHKTYFGTSVRAINDVVGQERNLLFDADTNTALNLTGQLSKSGIVVIDIFISPVGPIDLILGRPNKATDILRRRMIKRQRDDQEDIEGKAKQAERHLARADQFSYFVLNEENKLEGAVEEIDDYINEHLIWDSRLGVPAN